MKEKLYVRLKVWHKTAKINTYCNGTIWFAPDSGYWGGLEDNNVVFTYDEILEDYKYKDFLGNTWTLSKDFKTAFCYGSWRLNYGYSTVKVSEISARDYKDTKFSKIINLKKEYIESQRKIKGYQYSIKYQKEYYKKYKESLLKGEK